MTVQRQRRQNLYLGNLEKEITKVEITQLAESINELEQKDSELSSTKFKENNTERKQRKDNDKRIKLKEMEHNMKNETLNKKLDELKELEASIFKNKQKNTDMANKIKVNVTQQIDTDINHIKFEKDTEQEKYTKNKEQMAKLNRILEDVTKWSHSTEVMDKQAVVDMIEHYKDQMNSIV